MTDLQSTAGLELVEVESLSMGGIFKIIEARVPEDRAGGRA